MLSNEQFTRIAEKHGYDKILFGSDSPWYDQKRTIEMIANSGIDKSKLSLILGDNAQRVYEIPDR
jgi:predicted TIM-barrel fold metal-dependent hydrolase